jgi:putative phosphoribosyl transferase
MIFRDRLHAAHLLAQELASREVSPDALVLGLPRGGVPMARAIADALGAPVDVLLVRKLGVPAQPELAFGAIAENGARVLDRAIMDESGVTPRQVEQIAAREQDEIARRARLLRGRRPAPVLKGREVIVVDDGLATGSTMTAAVRALRAQGVRRIVVAVPVGSAEACERMLVIADELVCLSIPKHFEAVGTWYRDFSQVTDEEAKAALAGPPVSP